LSRKSIPALLALLTLAGCPTLPPPIPQPVPVPPRSTQPLPGPIVRQMQSRAQPLLDQELSGPQDLTRRALANATGFPAAAKTSLALHTLTDPWTGMAEIEARSLAIAAAARQGRTGLATLLAELGASLDRSVPKSVASSSPPPAGYEAFLDALMLLLEQTARHREQALHQISLADRQFLFDHGAAIVELFIPHVAAWNDRVQAEADADRRFSAILQDGLDDAALLLATQSLLQLLDPSWIQAIGALPGAAERSPPSGVTGEVLAVRETSMGLIVIGGPGLNSYDLDQRFALVIDVGGDDLYRGQIASTASPQHGISVVLDLSGNDSYTPNPLGLATGRLGVGLLLDLSGDDVYGAAEGSGGVGLAGIGLLYDESGNDWYLGSRFSYATAVGGIGTVVDLSGDDLYEGSGFSLGFGGPMGAGALIDVVGNDRYSCGGTPSPYNQAEAPTAAPGDPMYQYDCFGLGVGAGKRIFSPQRERLLYALAGGLGLLLDLAGDDRYESANFSQGAGYFFGVGVKLDLGGEDEHAAARYGIAAGAHFGVGLFLDRQGRDRYRSTGPVYTGAAAWDVSAALAIDAGLDGDDYAFTRTTGLGIADHRAWSAFIDEGGGDRYAVPIGLGVGLTQSLSGFFDLGSLDAYGPPDDPATAARARNGAMLRREPGGLFVDLD
jgi:hypothetical protein